MAMPLNDKLNDIGTRPYGYMPPLSQACHDGDWVMVIGAPLYHGANIEHRSPSGQMTLT